MSESRPRLFLIDGSSYIFRAFFGVPPRFNSQGLPTNAILGFTNMMVDLLRKHRPDYIAVVLDAGKENFRHRLFASYKSQRPKAPADLIPQLGYLRPVLEALGLPAIELADYEADDVIASLCKAFAAPERSITVVSADKDLMQLVGDGVDLLDASRGRWIGADEVRQKFGVLPGQVIEVMGLMGDAVDNIPGVRGIGAKTAMALIQRFHSLENLFERLDEIETFELRGAARLRRLLADGRESAFLSRALATVKSDLPLTVALDDLCTRGFHLEKLRRLFTELEFFSLLSIFGREQAA
jgi:5'-3' exonuclease